MSKWDVSFKNPKRMLIKTVIIKESEGPHSKSREPKIHFKLGSIFKNQSSNFRGSTVFRDMAREILAFGFPH